MCLPAIIGKKIYLSKVAITPTNQYFWNPEKPAIFDFNHR
jgi:hypothetical protein